MHWILQDNLFNESAYQVLLDTLVRFEIPHSIHKVIPFIGELTPPIELDTNNVICMGSYSLRHAAKRAGWTPGVFDLEPYDFQVQMQHWGDHMLNSKAVVVPFKDAVVEQRSFLRPIEDSKAFAGKVYDHYEFSEWQEKVCAIVEYQGDELPPGALIDGTPITNLTGDTLIQVCPLVEIYNEYRFWIINGKIICASMYKQGTQILYNDHVPEVYFEFVQAMIDIWQPLPTFVIDVASVPDDGDGWLGIKIVEINTLNSSGFYACNIQKLVMALEDAYSED